MALRSLPAGVGFKPPRAALAEDCRRERWGKGESKWLVRYGSRRRVQTNHHSGVEMLLDDIQTERHLDSRDKFTRYPAYRVSGVRRKGGVISIRARPWNCGNPDRDAKGEDQVKKSEVESTDARSGDGPICSSAEVAVMAAERRDRVVPVEALVNFPTWGG